MVPFFYTFFTNYIVILWLILPTLLAMAPIREEYLKKIIVKKTAKRPKIYTEAAQWPAILVNSTLTCLFYLAY